MNAQNQKIALVTGATGGLGTQMVKQFLNEGYIVAANYRNPEKAKALAAKLAEEGYRPKFYRADVTEFEQVEQMIQKIEDELGTIDVLVNNAGITRDGSFKKMSLDNWDAVMKTNLYSVFNCTRCVINGMLKQEFGRIINISSVNGQRAQYGQCNYAAAKAGMHGFTKTLAIEVANKGITVNTVSPGYIATDMVMAVSEDIRAKIIKGIPVGRLGCSEEISNLVSFLASEKSGYITGANYAINGGQHVY